MSKSFQELEALFLFVWVAYCAIVVYLPLATRSWEHQTIRTYSNSKFYTWIPSTKTAPDPRCLNSHYLAESICIVCSDQPPNEGAPMQTNASRWLVNTPISIDQSLFGRKRTVVISQWFDKCLGQVTQFEVVHQVIDTRSNVTPKTHVEQLGHVSYNLLWT